MMKMNKRGEEQSTSTGAIIAAVIAVVVLVIVILSIWLFSSGKLPFFGSLPSFNQTKPLVTDVEIFRYQILSDKLQYYDGTRWNDFKSDTTIEANGKKIEYNTLMNVIWVSFIGQSKDFGNGIKATIFPAAITGAELGFWTKVGEFYGWVDPDPNKHKIVIEGGFARLKVNWKDEIFYLSLDNKLLKQKEKEITGGLIEIKEEDYNDRNMVRTLGNLYYNEFREFVMRDVAKWRDSLIEKPVTIKYEDEDKKEQSITTCFMKDKYLNDKELVVDLSVEKNICS